MSEFEQKLPPAEIASMYTDMPATKIILQHPELTLCRIYSALRAEGVEVRPRGRRPILENPGVDVLAGMLEQNYSQREIGEYFGVSKRTVQRWLGK